MSSMERIFFLECAGNGLIFQRYPEIDQLWSGKIREDIRVKEASHLRDVSLPRFLIKTKIWFIDMRTP